MPKATNLAQLKKQMQQRLKSAMLQAKSQADQTVRETAKAFYASNPQKYERTGILGDALKVSDVKDTPGGASLEAYIDGSATYPNGSHPTVATVAGWAMNGQAGLQGVLEWDAAKNQIKQIVSETIKQNF